MSEQQTATEVQERPTPNGYTAWPDYWTAQGMPWRTEPEIDAERQYFLVNQRAITPDVESGAFPFKEIRLNRADIEWLLATHESDGVLGPVDWNDKAQRKRFGLDLRGANLADANLSGLPLASMRGGLSRQD